MPQREAIRTPSKRVSDSIRKFDVTPQEAKKRAQKKAKIAQLLKRGMVNDLLVVDDLPDDRRAVFVRDTEQDVSKYQALGYRIETEYGQKRLDHDPGTRVRIADSVLMTTDRENYEMILEVRAEMLQRKLSAGKDEYVAESVKNPDVPIIDLTEED